MKAGIILTGTGPILILTTHVSLDDPKLAEKLARKGIMKFMAFELDPELVRQRYGHQFDAIASEVSPSEDLRVLDYNGHNVFYNFSFQELGPPLIHD